jgi:hypothetical protein
MWIVAADNNGQLPRDARILKKICQLDDAPDIEMLIEAKWFDVVCQDGVKVASTCQPDDAPETETETETETEIGCPNKFALAEAARVAADLAALSKYGFEGQVIKVVRKDLSSWIDEYPYIDVIGHLKKLDALWAERQAKGESVKGRWIFAVHNVLKTENQKSRSSRPEGEAWI